MTKLQRNPEFLANKELMLDKFREISPAVWPDLLRRVRRNLENQGFMEGHEFQVILDEIEQELDIGTDSFIDDSDHDDLW